MKNKNSFVDMKLNGDKITMITAYDYPSARQVEKAEADILLIGDSLGMVVLGYDSTIKVTVEDMIHHGKAAGRGAPDTFKVVDMPFMSYHISLEDTLKNAKEIYQKTDCQALKVEGSSQGILTSIERLSHGGIPIVGHLGLTPQSVNVLGGYRVQGKNKETAARLLEDSLKVEQAGAIMLVLECVPRQLAALITAELSIPVIGIGAGAECDGQVLVYHDLLRYGVNRLPKFAKSYVDTDQTMVSGLFSYVKEVKQKEFPQEEHTFTMDESNLPNRYQE